MGSALDAIQKPINAEIKTFEKIFKESMKNNIPLLNKLTYYIVKRKGKQMRPMFVLLTASMFGTITDKVYRGATLIELLHTATLVHDDVVDDAELRRGFFSINALWKNKIAVLIGDYLLSRGLLIAVENKDFDLLEIVSNAVKMMSEGELLQLEKARHLKQTEEIYFDIIRKKTASLIASCCQVGACAAGATLDYQEQLRLLGEKIGITFQIKDDLFDYGTTNVGKPLGIDIKEKKMTLPLIYALSKAPKQESNRIRKLIHNKSQKSETVKIVTSFVKENHGLEYANDIMHQYHQEALNLLHQCPDNQYRKALFDLVNYTVTRKK